MANNEKALEISAKQFDETIANDKTPIVIIDFYAEWCMPCVMMAPILEEAASKLKGIKFAKVNVDENESLSERFGISSIPCLIVFKSGKEVERIIGAQQADVLEEKLKKYI